MTTTAPRYEIVHTGPAQFHARFVASNGETVMSSESYTRRRAAREAVETVSGETIHYANGIGYVDHGTRSIEVRYVDERGLNPYIEALARGAESVRGAESEG